jgi:capsular exopolysaccharide synthesis family protein
VATTISTVDVKSKPAPHAQSVTGTSEPLAQSLQGLLRELSWPPGGAAAELRAIGITSCYRGEGVSTVAAQLAVQAARTGNHRVLLVDFNLHDPSVHRTFHVDLVSGLAEALVGEVEVWLAIRETSVANLWVLPAGVVNRPGRPSYDPTQLSHVVQALKGEYDLVVFDMPGALEDDSTSRLASLLDGVVLVIEAERIRWEAASKGQQRLVRAQARVLGAVLNKRQEPIPDWLNRLL